MYVVIALITAALITADQHGLLLTDPADDFSNYHGVQARVLRVIDGDTIDVDLPDRRENRTATRIRLWGIDAPELGRAGERAQPFAEDSRIAAENLAGDTIVRLHVERQRVRDRYGRVLAHVELPDGTMLNRRLLLLGVAREDDRWPHTRLTHYAQGEWVARRANRGLWRTE